MPEPLMLWQLPPDSAVPDWFLQAVRAVVGANFAADTEPHTQPRLSYAAQLLWQRGIARDTQNIEEARSPLAGFLNPEQYQPTSPFAFGDEMEWAIARLMQARENQEKVAIWGDFDADGVTATAVLWEGLGQFFPAEHLTYHIPDRLHESHGLAIAGLDHLSEQGVSLIVTCDTGSTNLLEIHHANTLGIDVIITDHHTLLAERPPVVAMVNPRSLPPEHPLAHLSGVAVAYKLVEALYERLPDVPQRSLSSLLDLVAIGLIADLVELQGDCRYLAQIGIDQLQRNQRENPPPRPGIARLLDLCKRTGDRPTDISFGIGPRINAISRIHGDAHFAVELLTSTDPQRCRELAEQTELANSRRKALQRDVADQVRSRLVNFDLSTTSVIVLADPQWPVGILGLVAGQIAQEYGKPTILLNADDRNSSIPNPGVSNSSDTNADEASAHVPLARGSARSVQRIDLYQLMQSQSHLLTSFGGHPYAAGLSLPVANLPLFTAAINRQLRQQVGDDLLTGVPVQADLVVTVADLGKALFRELKLLEPYGMGNPVPQLLIQNCWFTEARHKNIYDLRGKKLRYIKTNFLLWDESTNRGFPGIWWEHYRDELPDGRCDAIATLDFNAYHKEYELRLIAVRSRQQGDLVAAPDPVDWVEDWRTFALDAANLDAANLDAANHSSHSEILSLTICPRSWDDLRVWGRRARTEGKRLAIAYSSPPLVDPMTLWQRLVGIAKYLSRTGTTATRQQWLDQLGIGDRTLQVGFQSLAQLGFTITTTSDGFQVTYTPQPSFTAQVEQTIMASFLHAVQEEQFRRRYFVNVPFQTITTMLNVELSQIESCS
jgi:single-stranded-DNA-specific exonuclease